MSLKQAIEHGKEHRKPYHDSRAIDKTCRSHGSCPWCIGRRKHNSRVREQAASAQIKEVLT
jgi:hypothetical protein